MLGELIDEHKRAREMVGELLEAKNRYAESGQAGEVIRCLKAIVDFYPLHIEKEDKRFFFPCLNYFSQDEQDRMLEEFYQFDRNMIHEKYKGVVEGFLGQSLLKMPSK